MTTQTRPALRAGFATLPRVPPLGLPMDGYAARVGTAVGVLDPLFARVAHVTDGERTVVIVVLEVLAVSESFCAAVRHAVRESTPGAAVLVAATHTHAAPTGFAQDTADAARARLPGGRGPGDRPRCGRGARRARRRRHRPRPSARERSGRSSTPAGYADRRHRTNACVHRHDGPQTHRLRCELRLPPDCSLRHQQPLLGRPTRRRCGARRSAPPRPVPAHQRCGRGCQHPLHAKRSEPRRASAARRPGGTTDRRCDRRG